MLGVAHLRATGHPEAAPWLIHDKVWARAGYIGLKLVTPVSVPDRALARQVLRVGRALPGPHRADSEDEAFAICTEQGLEFVSLCED